MFLLENLIKRFLNSILIYETERVDVYQVYKAVF